MKIKIFLGIFILALSSLACSINLPISWTSGGIGDVRTIEINETVQNNENASLLIEMGAGELDIDGGSNSLVSGSIRTNLAEWEPEITKTEESITISQDINTIPVQPGNRIINEWKLQLGNQPLNLNIRAGAYKADLDFSGVPITNLEIADGASEAKVLFASPNPVRMQTFKYTTGASNVEIKGLSNANIDIFTFLGGAGSAILDFSGNLMGNMSVEISSGVGTIRIRVPEGTHCVLHTQGELVDIDNDGWGKDGKLYETPGEGYTIDIEVNMSVGSLQLELD